MRSIVAVLILSAGMLLPALHGTTAEAADRFAPKPQRAKPQRPPRVHPHHVPHAKPAKPAKVSQGDSFAPPKKRP